ncbi:hypothetical protein ABK040_009801 [Willaertia magna]
MQQFAEVFGIYNTIVQEEIIYYSFLDLKKKYNLKRIEKYKKYDNSNILIKRTCLSEINLISEKERKVFITHNSFRNASKSLLYAHEKEKNFFDVFSQLTNLCNTKFTHILYEHFKQHSTEIISLVQTIIQNNHPSPEHKNSYKLLGNIGRKEHSKRYQLFKKDSLCISNKTLKDFVFSYDLDKIGVENNLVEIIKEVNKEIIEYFSLVKIVKRFKVNVNKLIIARIKSHLYCLQLRKINNKIINETIFDQIIIKLFMDGRVIDGLSTVVITLNFINLHTFSLQERNCIFPIVMFIGKESDIGLYISEIAKKIKEIKNTNIIINKEFNDASLLVSNHSFRLLFLWVSDLCSLRCISKLRYNGQFCPKCNIKRINSLSGISNSKNNLEHLFGIDDSNIIVCILHMDERISEYLLKMTLIGELTEKTIEENIIYKKIYLNLNI